jgi:hypothetical protein
LPADSLPAHSPLGPSAAERWLNCPGSVRASEGVAGTTSSFASEGTAAHMLTEWARKYGQPTSEWLGESIGVDGQQFVVDHDMVDATQAFVDYVEALPGDPYYEVRVAFDRWVPGAFGTADDIRVDEVGRTIYVSDYKHGKGVEVSAHDNPQPRIYALGVVETLAFLYDFGDDWQVRCAIHQPRIGNVSEAEPILLGDLLAWAEDVVRPAAEEALHADDPRFAAGDWCRWCPIRGGCVTRERHMQAEVLSDFEVLEDEGVHVLQGAALGRILDRVSQVKQWLADLEAHALSEINAGRPPVGADGPYKLVAGRSSRDWTDEEAARKALQRKLGAKEIWTRKLISVAQAEKKLGRDDAIMEKYVDKKQGKPTMVPASDKRQALEVDAASEFDVVGEED